MIVGIEIQTAIRRPTGVGLYALNLVKELALLGGDERFRLFYFDFRRRGCGFSVENPQFEFRPMRLIPGGLYFALSENFGMPDISLFAGRCDLFHFPNFIIPPLRRGKAAATVHDLSFARHPDYSEKKNLARLNKRFRYTLDRADAVISISDFTKRELMEVYGVPAARISVIPLGTALSAAAAPRRPLPFPYFLFVGTVEPRKNLGTLLEAWGIVKSRSPGWDCRLVIAGGRGWNCPPAGEQARERGLDKDVVVLNYVSHGELPSYYASAEALVYPSLYEGFGLPPLEAMACGAPVIASAIPPVKKVVGDAALLCEPSDAEGFARQMAKVRGDRPLRETLIVRGRERAKLFTWRRTAEETLALYRRLLR